MHKTGLKFLAQSVLLVLLVAFAGCETAPPVQEMSDARQAIAVAKEAGAEELAAEDLQQAESYLETAERRLKEHSYTLAKHSAIQAKTKALQALKASEKSRTDEMP